MKNIPDSNFTELSYLIRKEIKIVNEILNIKKSQKQNLDKTMKRMIESQMDSLKDSLQKTSSDITNILNDMSTIKPLPKTTIEFSPKKTTPGPISIEKEKNIYDERTKEKTKKHKIVDVNLTSLERSTIKRIKKKNKEEYETKKEKPSKYISFANNLFGDYSKKLSKNEIFISLNRDIIKSNLTYVIGSYISMIILTCIFSVIIGILIVIFLLFFNISTSFPIITRVTEPFFSRLIEIFWIPIVAPIFTFLAMYVYPSIEKSYINEKIDQELPFATIHMSAISGSMLEPSKMFSIIIATKEYPFLEKEFKKIINQINIYGYDFITALRNVATNSPSMRLAELLNGIATTINSGGDLPEFFDKRAQSLLFEYQMEREKYTKTAETFMDIYISLVIAAPMILMLLLMMMKVSGLGISVSSSTITLLMIFGVTMINIVFLVFLQLKQPTA